MAKNSAYPINIRFTYTITIYRFKILSFFSNMVGDFDENIAVFMKLCNSTKYRPILEDLHQGLYAPWPKVEIPLSDLPNFIRKKTWSKTLIVSEKRLLVWNSLLQLEKNKNVYSFQWPCKCYIDGQKSCLCLYQFLRKTFQCVKANSRPHQLRQMLLTKNDEITINIRIICKLTTIPVIIKNLIFWPDVIQFNVLLFLDNVDCDNVPTFLEQKRTKQLGWIQVN